MAKISFTKLNKIKSIPTKTITIADAEVSVAQYLPLEEKLNLIQSVIEQSGNNEEGFYNIVKLRTYYTIEMLRAYTNISFTEKQLEDIPKLYDAITINHIWEEVSEAIPDEELAYTWDNTRKLAREITDYNHSALGIVKAMGQSQLEDESVLNKINETLTKLQQPEEMKLVKAAITDMV